ncbi:hypothetical protein pEaSNUABM28_00243 [Erwinia phage pEa_SNUABM_28]|nr:hypothetical protein pEaSNUABM28_00243 [Erwinia phage pEa_SNUABM_28]QZE59144.1 hypothetical protein pEaSNUABM18_00241 [Erwinia phage pEa_SNUABM_18]
MSNLVGTAVALDHCRFYVENMVNIQFGNVLAPVPPEVPYNKPINSRVLHGMIKHTELMFDNFISRTDLQFPYAPILYRFRSIYGVYVGQYADDVQPVRGIRPVLKEHPRNPVPVKAGGEPDKEFASRFLKHTSEQVRSFLYMVCLDQYAREQTDVWLPAPPFDFDQPTNIHNESPIAFTTTHDVLVNHLMEAMLQTYSDTLDIHVSLRDYGLTVLFPLVAECRNVIYAAWPITRESFRTPKFLDGGEHVAFEDLPVDDDKEVWEPIPPMGPTFENQAEWEKAVTEIAESFKLQAFTDDGDSSFILKPALYASGDDFLFWNEGPLTDKSIFDIAVVPVVGKSYTDLEVLLRSVGKTIREYAVARECHIVARYIEQEDQIIGALFRVRRNIDFPNSPQEVMTHVGLA